MTQDKMSPLRARMIEDMRIRGMAETSQKAHIRALKDFTAFLGRSPDTATPDELRAYQLHMTDTEITPSVYNSRMSEAQSDAPLQRTLRGNRDALVQRAMDEPELGWRILITLNAFRLLISTAMLLLFAVASDPRFFGNAKPTLFAATAAGYLVFAILSAISLRQQWVPRNPLATTQLFADVIQVFDERHEFIQHVGGFA